MVRCALCRESRHCLTGSEPYSDTCNSRMREYPGRDVASPAGCGRSGSEDMRLDTGYAATQLGTRRTIVEETQPPTLSSTSLCPMLSRPKVGDYVACAECPLSRTGLLGYCRNRKPFHMRTADSNAFEEGRGSGPSTPTLCWS